MPPTVRELTDEEVLLQPTTEAVAPTLKCSNCGYTRCYTFWYKKLHFEERNVDFCPGCGFPICGVVTSGHGD